MGRDDDFREFVTASSPSPSRVAYLLTGDHHLAEDLLQSALASTFKHWRRVRSGSPEAYARRCMHHERVSWWRRRRVSEQLTDRPPEHRSGEGGRDPAERSVTWLLLVPALAVLTPRQGYEASGTAMPSRPSSSRWRLRASTARRRWPTASGRCGQ